MTLEEDQAEMRARMQAQKSTRRKSRAGTQPETNILQTPSAKSASPTEPTNTKSDPRGAFVSGPAIGKCETCGRPTSNPRFCSRSCAAVTNNAASPKRKVETDGRSRNRFRSGLYAAAQLDRVSVRGLPDGSVRVTKVGEWSRVQASGRVVGG
jgi:hypothetical protein